MDKEEFRRKAAEAERLADQSKSLTTRQRWRRIAQGWLAMLRRTPSSASSRQQDELGRTPGVSCGKNNFRR
jgi:hypothetical protein